MIMQEIVFFKTNRDCHVWCNVTFNIGYICRTETLKDASLLVKHETIVSATKTSFKMASTLCQKWLTIFCQKALCSSDLTIFVQISSTCGTNTY